MNVKNKTHERSAAMQKLKTVDADTLPLLLALFQRGKGLFQTV